METNNINKQTSLVENVKYVKIDDAFRLRRQFGKIISCVVVLREGMSINKTIEIEIIDFVKIKLGKSEIKSKDKPLIEALIEKAKTKRCIKLIEDENGNYTFRDIYKVFS
ncbi:MAG: hypothetical protein RR922_03215 [Clostridia bacterium]